MLVLAVALIPCGAFAADADNGRRLAQSHCAGCHIVAPGARSEVAAAPPFEAIARKYGEAAAVAQAITGPHPRMNFAPPPADAADIAAYIATLR